jgi:hypothetical protein
MPQQRANLARWAHRARRNAAKSRRCRAVYPTSGPAYCAGASMDALLTAPLNLPDDVAGAAVPEANGLRATCDPRPADLRLSLTKVSRGWGTPARDEVEGGMDGGSVLDRSASLLPILGLPCPRAYHHCEVFRGSRKYQGVGDDRAHRGSRSTPKEWRRAPSSGRSTGARGRCARPRRCRRRPSARSGKNHDRRRDRFGRTRQ